MLKKLFIITFAALFLFSCGTVSEAKNEKKPETKAVEKVKVKAVAPLPYLNKLPELIPRKILLGNPNKMQVQLSPDGTKLSWIAPNEKNILNVWVQTVGKDDATMITDDQKRGVRSYGWAWNGEQLFYIQDKGGDENWHLYVTNINSKETTDLTPFDGVRAQNFMLDRNHPDEIYIGLNKRNKSLFDMYLLNLKTGELTLDTENPGDVAGWMTDHNFVIRGAVAMNPKTADTIIRTRDNKEDTWKDLITFPFGENGGPVGFTSNNKNLYIKTSVGSDTVKLVEIDGSTGEEVKKIYQNDKVDLGRVFIDPITHNILGVSIDYTKMEVIILDGSIKSDYEYLKSVAEGQFYVVNANKDNTKWIVAYMLDTKPLSYYTYDRETKKADFLFTHQPEMEKYKLAQMKPVVITSRDGLEMVCYLTLPVGVEAKNLPMILYPHGGPWHRDRWGLNGTAQWLANRGYAVLQVNFRGSTGYGKKFLNAGNGEWGGKMQDDLTDAVKWAIKEGVADPKKVGIMGGSYGGYATLAGLTFTPDLYAVGVDIVGVAHMKTFFKTIPAYWATFKKTLVLRVGDVENDEELNKKMSPYHHADKIKVPLLIAQGKNDPRVNFEESNQMVEAMRKNNLPVTYVVYPDEGHGFARPENRLDFYGRTELFLKQYLGGRAQKFEKSEGTSAEEK